MTDMTETAAAATPTPTCPCCATPERSHALSVAPMIEVTDRHFRMLIRIIAPGASPHLWSEMTWDRAILYNAPSEPEFALNTNACRPGLGAIPANPDTLAGRESLPDRPRRRNLKKTHRQEHLKHQLKTIQTVTDFVLL